jgi:hypothetical protein
VTQSITEQIPVLSNRRKKQQEEALVKYFKGLFDSCKSDRAVVERRWYLNYAFYEGRQNVQYIRSSSSVGNYRLFVPPAPAWRVRLVINKVRNIVRKEISKTTSQKPIFTVVPETTEDEDIVAARAAEQIFYSAYSTKEIQTVIQQAGFWRSITGLGYIKTWWDPMAVDVISNQQGDICIERVRPFNVIVPDLLEEDIEKQPWVMHVWTMTPEDAQKRYGLDKLPDASINATQDIMEDSFLSMVGGGKSTRKETLCLEVWIKRHPDFPNGGMLTIVGDQLAQSFVDADGQPQYPYKHKEYPFTKLEHIPTGKYYPESTITDIVPIQRELNRTRSQLVENKNTTARPRFLSPIGAIKANKVTGEPGQNIEYQPGYGIPQALEMPQMPQYVMQSLDHLQSDLDDASGQHEISRGGTPNSQVTAATAISFLQEQDDSILALTVESQEKGIRKIGRQYLGLAEQYWTQERAVKVVGEDQYFDAQVFMGSAIKGNRDVRVEAGSALSFSKAARQAVIMDLMKNGMIDPQVGLQRMEIGGVEKLYEDLQMDRRHAQRENLRLAQGQPITPPDPNAAQDPNQDQNQQLALAYSPNTYDNHTIHMEQHNKYRKSQQFELLPQAIKAAFDLHVQLHTEAINAEMANALAQQVPPMQNGNQPGQPPAQMQPPMGIGGQ